MTITNETQNQLPYEERRSPIPFHPISFQNIPKHSIRIPIFQKNSIPKFFQKNFPPPHIFSPNSASSSDPSSFFLSSPSQNLHRNYPYFPSPSAVTPILCLVSKSDAWKNFSPFFSSRLSFIRLKISPPLLCRLPILGKRFESYPA